MIEIQCIRDEKSLRGLAPLWNDLLRRSASDCICMTWEWVSTWWDVYGGAYRPFVLVAREGGKAPCAIAPLMIGRGPAGVKRLFRHLMFIGQGEEVFPEYLDLIIERGREEELTGALLDFILGPGRRSWDVLLLERVLRSSPNFQSLTRGLQQRGLRLRVDNDMVCPFTPLPASWDEFLKTRSGNFRSKVRSPRKKLERMGEVRFLQADKEIALDRAFDLLVELNRERWKEQGASFRSESYTRFHHELCRRVIDRGWLFMMILTVDGEPVGARYDFHYADKIWNNQGGWRTDFTKLPLGNIMLAHGVEWAIEHGCVEYDFMGGDAEHKRRWSTDQRTMVDLCAGNTSLTGRGYEALLSLRQALRPVEARLQRLKSLAALRSPRR
jgi:CelD/BcsL family acetyltransferase involved in cellulose biosynthesis